MQAFEEWMVCLCDLPRAFLFACFQLKEFSIVVFSCCVIVSLPYLSFCRVIALKAI